MRYFIEIGHKKYEYSISPVHDPELGDDLSIFTCEAANIHQEFANADIPALLEDLPNLIEAEQEYRIKNSAIVRFRLTQYEKEKIQKNAEKHGYRSMSAFLKKIALETEGVRG